MSEDVFDAAEHARTFTRILLGLLRSVHTAKDYFDRGFPLLDHDQRLRYAHIKNACITPTFAELMRVINESQNNGIVSREEALFLREGLMGSLDWTVDEPK